MSIDSHNRQRGNDEADASLLVEEENSAEEADVVIGAVESNQADHQAADQLDAALGIKTKEPGTALLFGFWRNLSVLAGAGGDRRTFGITTGHGHEQPNSSKCSTPVRLALAAVSGPRMGLGLSAPPADGARTGGRPTVPVGARPQQGVHNSSPYGANAAYGLRPTASTANPSAPSTRRRRRDGPQALGLGQELQHQVRVAKHHLGHPCRHHLNDAIIEILVERVCSSHSPDNGLNLNRMVISGEMKQTYTAVIKQDGAWWIGWIEEVPGANAQEITREALLESLREVLAEALSMNRQEARLAAGSGYEELALTL